MVPTGLAIALPDGYAAFVHPRSGLAARLGVGIVNAPGTVDAGYRGEIKVLAAQPRPAERRAAARAATASPSWWSSGSSRPRSTRWTLLPGSARGDGGFGSTGGFTLAEAGPTGSAREKTGSVSVFRRASPTTTSARLAGRRRDQPTDDATAEDDPPTTAVASSAGRRGPGARAVGRRRGRRPGRRWPGRPGRHVAARPPRPGGAGRGRPGPADIVVAVDLVLGDGALQLQPFARPAQRGHLGRGPRRDPRPASPSRAARPTRSTGRSAPSCAPGPGRAAGRQRRRPAGPVHRRRRAALVPARGAHRRGRRSRTRRPRRWCRVFRDVVVVRGAERDGAARADPAAAAGDADGRPRPMRAEDGTPTSDPTQPVRARPGDHRDPLTPAATPDRAGIRWTA